MEMARAKTNMFPILLFLPLYSPTVDHGMEERVNFELSPGYSRQEIIDFKLHIYLPNFGESVHASVVRL